MNLQFLLQLIQKKPIESLLVISFLVCIPFFIFYFKKTILATRKLYQSFRKPKEFEYQLVVIGQDGSPFISQFIKENPKAKIAVIKNPALEIAHSTLSPSDMASANIDFVSGEAKINSPFEIVVNKKFLTTQNILIATGAAENIPEFEGLHQIDYLTEKTIHNFNPESKKVLIVGGNAFGCKIAESFATDEREVIIIEPGSQLLAEYDSKTSKEVLEKLQNLKVKILFNTRIEKFEKLNSQAETQFHIAVTEYEKADLLIEFDTLVLALGEIPNTSGFNFEKLEIPLNTNGTIQVDPEMKTIYPNIYAFGKVAGSIDY